MEWAVLSRLNLINGTTRQQERGNVVREREGEKKRQGQFTLRRLTIPAATSFLGRQTNMPHTFKTSCAAVSATRMTEHDIGAVHTDSQRECILRKMWIRDLEESPELIIVHSRDPPIRILRHQSCIKTQRTLNQLSVAYDDELQNTHVTYLLGSNVSLNI